MKLSLGILCVLVLWGLQQIQDCRGQALIGSSLPIMAIVGDDVILPCFLQPPRNAAALTFEWTRPDLQPRFVFVWRQNEIRDIKNPHFVNRAFLFQDELKHGNISLKLTNVKPKDSGVYRCFIPALEKETSIKLTVGSSSPVVVSVAEVDVWGPRVVLHCASGGWSPEPELWWLDSEGRLLSVERSVSVSDGVYEVSSRVTVKQSGTFNCTVTQSSTNLSEWSSVQVEDDVFTLKIFPLVIGLMIGLLVLAGVSIIVSILFCITKQKYSQQESKFQEASCADKAGKTSSQAIAPSVNKVNKEQKPPHRLFTFILLYFTAI
ncbi:butyrophilin-like protein 2 [Periophthalmus magnuspinnatus]|uniref:butyrophilin-like protein 2 n=1 Tax=Periophthalmus magnuspinnatus TaxID=409849 RepID=UPI002436AC34|nr:butyrophilin-like protein 2 [Periophthalmus magnuspinnatus]